jgi:hypothetical protein
MKSRKKILFVLVLIATVPAFAIAADTAATKTPAKPVASKVDPALEAAHTKEDVRRHRIIAAAHEAAARCQESGKDETICDAELEKACKGIAYGKYCGMKHPD